MLKFLSWLFERAGGEGVRLLLRDLFLDALRSDGRVAEALLDLFTKHPEAKLKLAQAVAGSTAVPFNVATNDTKAEEPWPGM
jgi:hypothetical protein